MTTGKLYERVALKLSDAAVLKLGKEQAAKHAEHKAVQEEKAEALNTFNARLKTLEAEVDDLANKINNQQEEVDIEVREEFDYARKMVVKVRVDNGQPISHRPMTLNEEGEEKMRQLRVEQGDADGDGHEGDPETTPADDDEKPKGRRSRKSKNNAEASDEAPAE
jgi:hypothetical protein